MNGQKEKLCAVITFWPPQFSGFEYWDARVTIGAIDDEVADLKNGVPWRVTSTDGYDMLQAKLSGSRSDLAKDECFRAEKFGYYGGLSFDADSPYKRTNPSAERLAIVARRLASWEKRFREFNERYGYPETPAQLLHRAVVWSGCKHVYLEGLPDWESCKWIYREANEISLLSRIRRGMREHAKAMRTYFHIADESGVAS